MRAIKIASLILVGGILGFILRSIGFNHQQPLAEVKPKLSKSIKPVKRSPTANKTRKKKEESKREPKIN